MVGFELLGGLAAELSRLGIVAVTFDVSAPAAATVRARDWMIAALDSAVTSGVWATVEGADSLELPALHRVAIESAVGGQR